MRPAAARGQMAISLVIAILLALLGALGVQYWRSSVRANAKDNADQLYTAKWSRDAIQAFAAWHARLPCPARDMGGAEDCSLSGGKGWLPTKTLLNTAPGEASNVLAARYVVYREPSRDLAATSDVYELIKNTAQNGYDLCTKLAGQAGVWRVSSQGAGLNTAYAYSWDIQNQQRNIAYGLAIASKGESLSDLDAGGSPAVEPPSKERDMVYRDLTDVVPFDVMFMRMGCNQAIASTSAIEAAWPFGAMAEGGKQGVAETWTELLPVYVALTNIGVFGVVSSAGDLVNEGSVTAESAAQEGACMGMCPNFYAAMATEGVASAQSIAALTSATVTLAWHIAYVVWATLNNILIQATPVWPPELEATLPATAEKLGGL